ncbi:hypothetical protein [Ulvibacterium marinum]|uniref:hypothetical protein n=1 Tax=Ulvibacterium marinum TaxID=2419782 RepID=UPI0011C3B44E|nr:hypothetical protein [Ulvibacterium marinum]
MKDINIELLELKSSFLNQKDWKYARKAYEMLNEFEDEYRNEHFEFAGYSENLVRIKNSILMVDRENGETQFIHGISSMIDIITRGLNSR